ncbi:DUF1028 domain-containing protein [Rhodobaculum claviforme]|uniref:DUF1028 domain-containing protein n=1 Tax=Rhodobaculum claviforme TaxID=1549854 RepID=A0A934TMZ4_9RHOB|nr:DUF1028 domain-containing protein [Rhodobaculum claviforme]MBK5928643.1 hypothetical protein [Rhodobaculum claviforme]
MTFSLAGRCARSGMFGCVVTTSSVAVGARCPYAAPGLGAVLTQHMTDPRLGPLGLEMLRLGYSAPQVLAGLVAVTPRSDWRQLGVIDAQGRTATFTGESNKPEKGDLCGQDCFALANIVRSATVPAAMVAAFEARPQDHIARRLLDALVAGHDAGSEFAPLIATALLVVDRYAFPHVDLRVDGDPDPIASLERLWAAYEPLAGLYDQRATDPDHVVRTHHTDTATPAERSDQ